MTGPDENATPPDLKGVVDKALGPAAADFGREIRPLGKEVGQVTTRAVRLGLKAVSGLVWGFEQIGEYVAQQVSERLKDIPPDQIAEANPRVAVPAIEAMRYSSNEDEIRDLFVGLIAADLNLRTKQLAHPSFVEIIKQMSATDAHVLEALYKNQGQGIILCLRLFLNKEKRQLYNEIEMLITLPMQGLNMPEVMTSLSSLDRLGLVDIDNTSYPAGVALSQVEQFRESDAYKKQMESFDLIVKAQDGHHSEHMRGIRLTPLGRNFANICLSKPNAETQTRNPSL